MSRSFSRLVFMIMLLAAGIGVFIGLRYYASFSVPRGLDNYHVLIPTGATFEQVTDSLMSGRFIRNAVTFSVMAEKMGYRKDVMRSGRYQLKPGMSMIALIRHLRNGEQAPVNVVLTNERLIEDVAAKVARFIEPDSAEILALLTDDIYLDSIGYSSESVMSVFIPNTYQVYWNTSARKFMERMIREHEVFWSQSDRIAKAAELKMTPEAVYTLASIVDKETLSAAEKPRIAGTYLNRLRIDMPLQADPTAVFATRDFETRRVTEYHTKFDSPYNTYMYTGLPPGPIGMASISGIDAVLNPERHNYYYFCALGDESGLHAFAESYPQHLGNVARYVQKLKERGLR